MRSMRKAQCVCVFFELPCDDLGESFIVKKAEEAVELHAWSRLVAPRYVGVTHHLVDGANDLIVVLCLLRCPLEPIVVGLLEEGVAASRCFVESAAVVERELYEALRSHCENEELRGAVLDGSTEKTAISILVIKAYERVWS